MPPLVLPIASSHLRVVDVYVDKPPANLRSDSRVVSYHHRPSIWHRRPQTCLVSPRGKRYRLAPCVPRARFLDFDIDLHVATAVYEEEGKVPYMAFIVSTLRSCQPAVHAPLDICVKRHELFPASHILLILPMLWSKCGTRLEPSHERLEM